MKLQLTKAHLQQRYKRFLADITLENGDTTTIHCANTGAMTGCAETNDIVWFSQSNNPKRKYPFSWEFTEKSNGDLICVNTARANQVVVEALNNNAIDELSGFANLKTEVPYGEEKSRIDILLEYEPGALCYVEVKSVTLLQDNQGYFPDAKTIRGQKHLRELISMQQAGFKSVLFFAVLHTGINSIKPAAHIDPRYAELLGQAKQAGVTIIAYKAQLTSSSITLQTPIPVLIE